MGSMQRLVSQRKSQWGFHGSPALAVPEPVQGSRGAMKSGGQSMSLCSWDPAQPPGSSQGPQFIVSDSHGLLHEEALLV